ncbi:MAG: amidohydrolase family protein [Alphaproteobacteria bacterium]|nr:amidohydrolase family protein [Alphaproteobacteria bacterium]MBV9863647.1 amidohydrolase family protein [Alphaproteobacteria bacterium]
MKTFVRCGSLFDGRHDEAQDGAVLVVGEDGRIDYAGPEAGGPRRARGDRAVDHSDCFVMPGLIDVHTHLAYGNAKSEEDIDLYSPLEFRALRGMFFAQKVLAAGYTAICSPGDAGQISLAIRNAIRAGLFEGPRVMAAGPYLTTHQGLTDWYPTWIGAPDTSIGKLVTTVAEAVEEIRRQVKNGVDCVKLALDGIQRRPDGELIAAFTQEETDIMVREIHRLGKKAIAHAVGREATLYAARAGIDLIFHGFGLDEECIAAMLETGSALGPTLTHPRNLIDFTQPHEPAAQKGRVEQTEQRYRDACISLRKARAAGVPFLAGTDSGFAITPYGEWHARELELFVEDLGFTPAQALRIATESNGRFMAQADGIGVLEPGGAADFIALDGSPLADIRILQDKSRLRAVYLAGREIRIPDRSYDPRQVTDFALSNWTDVYTRERVAELRQPPPRLAAE